MKSSLKGAANHLVISITIFVLLLFAYNNCGLKGFAPIKSTDLASLSATSNCTSEDLTNQYRSTFHAFYTNPANGCFNCHTSGGKNFADGRVEESFKHFIVIPKENMISYAGTLHGGGSSSSPQKAQVITGLYSQMDSTLQLYKVCAAGLDGSGPGPSKDPIVGPSITTNSVQISANSQQLSNRCDTNNPSNRTLSINLSQAQIASGPARDGLIFSFEVCRLQTQSIGYIVSGFKISNSTPDNYRARKVKVYINNVAYVRNTFDEIDAVIGAAVNGTATEGVLRSGGAVFDLPSTQASDRIHFEIAELNTTTKEPDGGGIGPLGPFAQLYQDVLRPRCSSCHNSGNSQGGLNVENYTSLLNRVVPGDALSSLVYQRITSTDMTQVMPPSGNMSEPEINAIRDWINAGANQ